jgi:glycosyltransferase involved in cell wall biosynthesis
LHVADVDSMGVPELWKLKGVNRFVDKPPLVSVVIATHDRPAYLRSAIESVLRGNYQTFEIVVTDDASSADNRNVVDSFRDPRLLYRRNAARLGSAANHREGLSIATGEYVALLNDDDEWEPEFLERMVPIIAANSEIVVCFSDHWIINAKGDVDPKASDECTRRFKRDVLRPGLYRPFYRLALLDQSVPMVAALLRRNAIDWDSPQRIGSVYDFWVTYLAARTGMGAWYLPERLARYRVHATNETSIGGDRFKKPMIYLYSRLIADPAIAELRPELRTRLQQAHRGYGIFLLQNGDARRARRHLWAAMPNSRAAIALALSIAPKFVARWAART